MNLMNQDIQFNKNEIKGNDLKIIKIKSAMESESDNTDVKKDNPDL